MQVDHTGCWTCRSSRAGLRHRHHHCWMRHMPLPRSIRTQVCLRRVNLRRCQRGRARCRCPPSRPQQREWRTGSWPCTAPYMPSRSHTVPCTRGPVHSRCWRDTQAPRTRAPRCTCRTPRSPHPTCSRPCTCRSGGRRTGSRSRCSCSRRPWCRGWAGKTPRGSCPSCRGSRSRPCRHARAHRCPAGSWTPFVPPPPLEVGRRPGGRDSPRWRHIAEGRPCGAAQSKDRVQ